MSETPSVAQPSPPVKEASAKRFLVSSPPHLASGRSTRGIMFDVVAGMLPMWVVGLLMFKTQALVLPLVTVCACLATEALANRMRGRGQRSLLDGSAVVTGMILAFSLPPMLPAFMAVVGGVVAIGLAKMIFGGLGQNLFNPAMVGRAFLMACFPVAMTTWTEPGTLKKIGVDAVTQATPLAVAKFHSGVMPALYDLFIGNVSGSIGETSALAALVGGLFLILRGTADYRQPVGMLAGVAVFAAIAHRVAPQSCASPLVHLTSGAVMFGAFFIATDYVGSPITPLGRWIFGVGAGLMVMVIRIYGGYPEGVMFAILMMNALTPLIERWTVPEPFGGKVVA